MGREFLDLFDNWASSYDDSVAGYDPQYEEVFHNYDVILDEVIKHASGRILEFGIGTGNLTEKLIKAGFQVIGVEPSKAMRELAKRKLPDLLVMDGDFIDFPAIPLPIDSIVSTYAFHHLTVIEKRVAIKQYAKMLSEKGMIVFADTMFTEEKEKGRFIEEATAKGYSNLAEDLKREYYPTIDVMRNIFNDHNFDVSFKQMNQFVWLVLAKKNAEKGANADNG